MERVGAGAVGRHAFFGLDVEFEGVLPRLALA